MYLGSESLINDALHRGGAVVVRLYLDEPHYVLLTGEHDGVVEMFDPYYRDEPFNEQDILLVTDRETSCNRLVPEQYFNQEGETIYALGSFEGREAVILFNGRTKLEPEKTIEYFI